MDAVSSQPVPPNVRRAPARAEGRTCAKGPKDRSKSVSAKRNSRSSTHSLFKRAFRFELAQRGCVGPDATPHDLGDNPTRSEFNYTLENGQRTKLEETFYFDHDSDPQTADVAKSTTYDWVYDANDRLLSETIDHHDDDLDRTESFVMDLFGNRTNRTVDYVDPTAVDQAFAYSYDDNDRLTSETLDENADGSINQTTQYSWDSTQQTAKEIFIGDSTAPADLVSSQTFGYDLQGRLAEVITTPESGSATKVTYEYDSAGIRVSSSQFTDVNTNGIFETSELDHTIEYLVDHRNHTGYAQTIAETTTDGNGDNVKRITTTFGTDELSQTTYTPDPATADAWLADAVHFFGHDAHGSVRILLDALGEIAQTFTYAAYGELLAIYDNTETLVGTLGAADTSAALTSLLYSGESFDSRIGQQYFRARWYEATAGRFSRLDPYFGTLNDPLSFNKYNYVHSNPILGIDPSGLSFASFSIGTLGGLAQRIAAAATSAATIKTVTAGLAGLGVLYGANRLGVIGTPDAPPGFAEGLIPFWGSGKAFLYDVNNGNYGRSTLDAFFFVTDGFLLRSIASGIGQVGFRNVFTSGSGRFIWGETLFGQKHAFWIINNVVYHAFRPSVGPRWLLRVVKDKFSGEAWEQTTRVFLGVQVPLLSKGLAQVCGSNEINCVLAAVRAANRGNFGIPERFIKSAFLNFGRDD